MNNKRTRKTIYKWIDIFFLTLPLFLFLCGVIFTILSSISLLNNPSLVLGFNDSDGFYYYIDAIVRSLFVEGDGDSSTIVYSFMGIFDNIFSFDLSSGSFAMIIDSKVYDFFEFLGFFENDSYGNFNGFYFLQKYFSYIIEYEFLSLIIQIVLWIPRFFKNRLENIGGVE